MLPWSVMPIAGWPSAAAAATSVADPGRAVEHRELGVQVEVGERISHDQAACTSQCWIRSIACCPARMYPGCADRYRV